MKIKLRKIMIMEELKDKIYKNQKYKLNNWRSIKIIYKAKNWMIDT